MTDQTGSASENEAQSPSRPAITPRRRIRAVQKPAPASPQPIGPAPSSAVSQQQDRNARRAKATKDENGKWQPTGNYQVGFGRPPLATRFAGKPGPGRPKGSVNYDGMLLKQLAKTLKVRIDGKEKTVTQGELVIITTVRDAMEGKSKDARKQILSDMLRLSPVELPETTASVSDYNEADKLTFDEFYQTVRDAVIAELGLQPEDGPVRLPPGLLLIPFPFARLRCELQNVGLSLPNRWRTKWASKVCHCFPKRTFIQYNCGLCRSHLHARRNIILLVGAVARVWFD